MFARIVELFLKAEGKDEFLDTIRTDVMPVLKKQPGFLQLLPFLPEAENARVIVITRWAEKRDLDRYVRESFPKVADILRPYLLSPITSGHYTVESSLCPHFIQSMAA